MAGYSIKRWMTGLVAGLFACQPSGGPQVTEVHHVPAGFTGKVTIWFSVDGVSNCAQGDAALVYQIGANGVAQCAESLQYHFRGLDHFKVYYVDAGGNEMQRIPFEKEVNDPNAICFRGPYPVGTQLIYYIDRKSGLDAYPNPAIDEEGRK